MRRSLLLRLLGLSLVVASLAVAATALLATYGTGNQLRGEAERSASLLEADSLIHSSLLTYASDHRGWDGVEALVRELADQTGRRIALTTPDGRTIVDSARLLDQRSGDPPSIPAARIDAAAPPERDGQVRIAAPPTPIEVPRTGGVAALAYYSWQLTEPERQARQALADEAVACLREQDIEATIYPTGGPAVTYNRLFTSTGEAGVAPADEPTAALWASRCIPQELNEPSAAALERNERAVQLTTACLAESGLAYEVSADSYGMRIVEPVDSADAETPAWTGCRETAYVAATRPYVAPPADLYLGTSDRFDVFSVEGWRRTAATTAVVLAAAAAVTVLAGRRLVRPILALTAATQRMGAGDHATRVPVRGNDEVTRLAAAFNAMAESIECTERQRKALVSDVAHELRNPLANVRSHLEGAEYGVVPLDATLVQSLLEESTLLERLVADLQDLALADAGMLRLHPEERDAADVAGQAVAAQRARAESAGVTVRLDAPAPVPVFADPGRLRQALGNLVANAVTHTPAGGTVDVAVRRAGGSVLLTVTDTGPGIAPEHLPYVFDRFYRADRSRSRATGGSGLGLAITRHLVEEHDGEVEAASIPGAGSVFTIRLPGTLPE
jgi:two-component system sensor histidine kinase BaeS